MTVRMTLQDSKTGTCANEALQESKTGTGANKALLAFAVGLRCTVAFAVPILQQFIQSLSHGSFCLSIKKSCSHAPRGPELRPDFASCGTAGALLLAGGTSVGL